MQLSDLTRPEAEYFRKECNFTPTERRVFDLRVSDKSIMETQIKLGMYEGR